MYFTYTLNCNIGFHSNYWPMSKTYISVTANFCSTKLLVARTIIEVKKVTLVLKFEDD